MWCPRNQNPSQKSVQTLIEAWEGHIPEIEMQTPVVVVLATAIVIKMFLYVICIRMKKISGIAETLAEVI